MTFSVDDPNTNLLYISGIANEKVGKNLFTVEPQRLQATKAAAAPPDLRPVSG